MGKTVVNQDSPESLSYWLKKTLLNQADKTKKDVTNLLVKEVREFLSGIELDEILRKVLAGQEIEITTRIKIKKAASKTASSKHKKT